MNKAATNSLYLTNLADSIRQFWFSPNRRIVEPLKLGLAMAIIYAIAFYMGWSKPYWATVSAVSVNLLSTGLTLHRGLIRVLGTAVGGFMGLALIGVFPVYGPGADRRLPPGALGVSLRGFRGAFHLRLPGDRQERALLLPDRPHHLHRRDGRCPVEGLH
jgi:hypothetical protein